MKHVTPYTYDTLPLDTLVTYVGVNLDKRIMVEKRLYVGKNYERLLYRLEGESYAHEGSAYDAGCPLNDQRKFVDNYHRILPIEAWIDVQKFAPDDLAGYLAYIGEFEAAARAAEIKAAGRAAAAAFRLVNFSASDERSLAYLRSVLMSYKI